MTPRLRTLLMTTAGLVLMGTVVGRAGTPQASAASDAARLKRGAYLVNIMSCNDCHTPFKLGPKGPEPDMSRMLSGHPQDVQLPPAPASGPWLGHSSATNTA